LNISQALQHVEIFDLLGATVLKIDELTSDVNVEKLPKGIYLLKGQDESGQTVLVKFIKK
jgi:hypothetical protein